MCILCKKGDFMIETLEALITEKEEKEVREALELPSELGGLVSCRMSILISTVAGYAVKHRLHPGSVLETFVNAYNKRVLMEELGHTSEITDRLRDYES